MGSNRCQCVCVMCQSEVALLALLRVFHMPFEFVAEMPDGSRHGPCGCITKRTDGIAFDLPLDNPQQIDIAQLAFAVFDLVQDLFHPSGTLAAGRTLSAALMAIETGQRQGMTHHALVFIEHDESAAAHHATGGETAVAQAFVVHQPLLAFCRFYFELSDGSTIYS